MSESKGLFLKTSMAILILVESVFFYFILTLPISEKYTVRYLSIVIAVAFSLIFLKVDKKLAFVSLGFLLTALADYFLAYSNPIREIEGVSVFCFVQLSYFLYLLLEQTSKKARIIHIILRIIVVLIAQICLHVVVGSGVDKLSTISLFYIANLVVNVIIAFSLGKEHRLFAIGLLLFLCCDIVVGLNSAIGVYINIPRDNFFYKLAFSNFDFAWLFYLPSQVIISIFIAINNKRAIFFGK